MQANVALSKENLEFCYEYMYNNHNIIELHAMVTHTIYNCVILCSSGDTALSEWLNFSTIFNRGEPPSVNSFTNK